MRTPSHGGKTKWYARTPDQADALRKLVGSGELGHDTRQAYESARGGSTRVIAVTSGKGGVGKTNFVVNLAVVMSDLGLKVTILDADLGLANVDLLLGVPVRHNLHHVINGTMSLNDIIIEGPHGVEIIPGASGLRGIADLSDQARTTLIDSLSEAVYDRDLLIIDTAAGLGRNVMDFVLAAEEVIVLTVPEPAAMTDAYAMLKVISRENPDAAVRVVINMCSGRDEAENVADQLNVLTDRFLQFQFDALGYIPTDPAVSKAVRQRQPYVLAYPSSPAAASVMAMGRRLMGLPRPCREDLGVGSFFRRFLGAQTPDYLL